MNPTKAADGRELPATLTRRSPATPSSPTLDVSAAVLEHRSCQGLLAAATRNNLGGMIAFRAASAT